MLTSKQIGATMEALRKGLGMTTTVLGRKVGITGPHVRQLETGRTGFYSATMVKIAKALKVPPFRLLMTEREWAKWSKRRKR